VRSALRYLVPCFLALVVASCEETTTGTKQSTFVVEISVGGSPHVGAGDYLVGDEVRFSATVTEDGQPFPASGQHFASNNSSVVRILDASLGTAEFVNVGDATVTVTFEEPELEGSEKLGASMDVSVTAYTVALSLESVVTGSAVDASDGLVGDTLRVLAEVTKDGQPVASSGLKVKSSSDPTKIQAVPGQENRLALIAEGTARVTITLDKPDIPGTAPLEAAIDIDVNSFVVQLEVTSLVPGNASLADGDTLVTDSVRFSATVQQAGGSIPTTGANWESSDASIVRITDPAQGIAVFVGIGTATVSVGFADPKLPGEPFGKEVRVTTLVANVQVESNIAGPEPLTEFLVTDSVTFSAMVEKDGLPWSGGAVTLANTESTNPAIIEIIDALAGTAVFADTGQASATVTLAQPRLPRAALIGSLPLRVTTFIAEVLQTSPDTTPAMGDIIDYGVVVTRTRDNTEVMNPAVTFASSDPSVIQITNPATGAAFARDTGRAVVGVTVNNPSLPAANVAAALPATDIVHERFYGAFSATSGSFGATPGGDSITVEASPVHLFTDSTRVEFPNGTVGFVEKTTADSLVFLVPAAANSGHLILRNLQDDAGGYRDSVQTRDVFTGPGAGAVDDFFEPNDNFPLTSAVKITPPFEALLSWDPSKSAPADTNFFYMVLTSASTFDFVAEWQQDADMDFRICGGNNDPPTDYLRSAGQPICQRTVNSTDRRTEQELGLTLSANIYVIAFYCKADQCPVNLPLTYKVRIQ
jgi:hypothetical protein